MPLLWLQPLKQAVLPGRLPYKGFSAPPPAARRAVRLEAAAVAALAPLLAGLGLLGALPGRAGCAGTQLPIHGMQPLGGPH